jgi:hypothetical protein
VRSVGSELRYVRGRTHGIGADCPTGALRRSRMIKELEGNVGALESL